MRQVRKRLGSILLTAAMILSLLPVGALASSVTDCQGGENCTHQAAITVGATTTHYDTLQEALNAATNGETVKLLRNIDNSVNVEGYDKGINYSLKAGATLDGDGHTLSGHIGVHIPAAGATVQNVKFLNIHNKTEVDKDTCEYYGWESKTGNQSAIYASGLTGTVTITGCTFDNIDWDAIQITPTKTAGIVITDNVFQHTNTTDTQLRYVHIEYTAGYLGTAINELTITDNQFYVTENTKDSFCSVGVWKVNKNTTTLKLYGNYLEDPSSTEVTVIGTEYMFPSRSQATVDTDDYQPVAYDGAVVFDNLQQAVDKTTKYVRMMVNTDQTAAIPEGKEIYFYSYGHAVGTITNNGSMQIYGSDLAGRSKIVNNGTMSLSGSSATVYDIENNGTIKITSGTTYDLSKITGSGTVTITGGTFSTKPSDAQLAQWYKAVEQSGEPVTYKVSSMTMAEKVEAGLVATSGSSTGNHYTSVTQGVNATDKATTYLQTDSDEDVVIRTPYSGGRSLYANKHSFTGSIVIQDNCDFLNLLGSSFNLRYASGDRLRIGFYSTAADVTIQDADLDLLEVSASGDCTVAGGNYGSVIAHTYYASKTATEPKYTAELSITGGCFAGNTITRQYTDIRPEGVPASEEVPLSAFLPEGYTVVEGTGAYPYQVVAKEANAAEVVPAAPSVTVPEGNEAAAELAEQLKQAEDLVPADSLSTAAGSVANNNTLTGESQEVEEALKDAQITPVEGETVTIVIQPYMDVEIKEVSATEDSKTLKLDIVPKYNVVATTATLTGDNPEEIVIAGEGVKDANAAIVEKAQNLTITQPVEVTIPLPSGFVNNTDTPVYVQHKGYEYTAEVKKTDDADDADDETYFAVFTNPHGFSEFTITTTSEGVASTNGTVYTSFQAAVDAAQNGDTITVIKAAEGETFTATITGSVSKSVKVKNDSGNSITVTINGVPQTIASGATSSDFTYTYTPPTGGGGDGGSTSYAVTLPSKVENGSLSVSPSRASKGTKVTITVKPDAGYELDALTVTDKSGKVVELTKVSDGKYTFTMPASQVTIAATFKQVETVSPVDRFTDVAENAWYYQAVKYAVEKGLMSGTGDTTFAPGLTLSRSMIAQMLYALEGKPAVQDSSFTDISSDAWYADAAAWAQSKGIITGYDNGAFGPDDPLTREQLTLILYNYARIKGYNVSAKGDLSSFVDGDSTSVWARESMTWAVGAGLLSGQGMGMLAPTGTATRAEVAQIMMNFCETIAK